jgi:hypothetical protein
MCTGPVPASLWPVAEGAGEAVPRVAGEAAGEAAARYRGGEAAYGEAGGGRVPGLAYARRAVRRKGPATAARGGEKARGKGRAPTVSG